MSDKGPIPYSWKNNVIVRDGVDYTPPNQIPTPISIGDQSFTLQIANTIVFSIWHSTPKAALDYGEEGWQAYNSNYRYIYTNGSWKRQSMSTF